jgi:cbb3-type cytochrome oxidase maturation protein
MAETGGRVVKDLTLDFLYLVPIALCLGTIGLAAFIWSLNSGQYDDLDGAAERILFDDEDFPLPQRGGQRTPGARQP